MAKITAPTAVATTSVTNTHLALATLAMLAAGGFAYIAAAGTTPTSGSNSVRLQPNQTCRQLDTGYGYNNSKGGIQITNATTGRSSILSNGCRDAGHGLRNYTLTCNTSNPTLYNVSWVSCTQQTPVQICIDGDNGANKTVASSALLYLDGQIAGGDNVIDSCDTATNTVLEGVCNGNIANTVRMPCDSGFTCTNGACVADPASALQVSWASDSPASLIPITDSYVSSRVIGKVNFNNTKSVPVTVKAFNININSTLPTTGSRDVALYSIVANSSGSFSSRRIAQKTFAAGVSITDTSWTDADVTDVTIPANGTIAIEVQMLVPANTPAASQATVSVDANDIIWNDGATTFTTAQGLPLVSRTLSGTPRTTISASWASDSPTGDTARGVEQIIGKIVVSNAANSGSYDATIKALNVKITLANFPTSSPRTIKLYKDAFSPDNLLATHTTSTVNNKTMLTRWKDADVVDASIAAGTPKTFIVTMNTQDALSFARVGIMMSQVNFEQSEIEWSDGLTPNIAYSAFVTGLPLSPKVLVY